MPSITAYAVDEMSVTNLPGNYGNGKDNHMPVGYWSRTGWRYRGLLKFWTGSGTIPTGARLVKVTLKLKTTNSSYAHVDHGRGST